MRYRKGLAALALGWSFAVGATDQPLQIERAYTTYTVQADGRYVETRETAIKVLKQAALEYAKDASVTYSTSVQRAEIIEAYTLKPDGRRIVVPPGNFQVNAQGGRQGDSPIYSDQTTLTAVFPELAVGDTTVLAYRIATLQPMFEGQFSLIESFSPATYYGDVRVTVDAPESSVARDANWQMQQTRRAVDGRSIIEWRWQNRAPVDPDSIRDSTYNVERYPGLAYSTFPGYAAISAAYGAKAGAKAFPTERIRVLADEIAGQTQDPRQVAQKLYDWVARNITYAGNCIGLGAVVPRDMDVVLDNKMGDCKDHATLLQALLSARGIDSTQALVNAGQVYDLPEIPVASMVNHVINYIPGLDLYLDSTAATVPFGSLPGQVAGKRTLLVGGYTDTSKTPVTRTGSDWQKMKLKVAIAANGSVRGTQSLQLGGRLALAAREQFRDLGAEDAAKMVKRYFQQAGLKAQGSIRHDDPQLDAESFGLEAQFQVDRMLPMPGGMPVQPWFLSYAPVGGIVVRNQLTEDQPAGESGCGGVLSEEEYEFEFAGGTRIASMPGDVSVEDGNVRYVANYRRDGNRVFVKRVLEDRTPGPVCTAEYNTAYAETLRKVLPDVRTQIVYLPPGVTL